MAAKDFGRLRLADPLRMPPVLRAPSSRTSVPYLPQHCRPRTSRAAQMNQRNSGRTERVEGVFGTDDLTFTVTW